MPQTANLMWCCGDGPGCAGATACSMTGAGMPSAAMARSGRPAIMAMDPISPAWPAWRRKSRRQVDVTFIAFLGWRANLRGGAAAGEVVPAVMQRVRPDIVIHLSLPVPGKHGDFAPEKTDLPESAQDLFRGMRGDR